MRLLAVRSQARKKSSATIVNLFTILLLIYAAKKSGQTYWQLINYRKGVAKVKRYIPSAGSRCRMREGAAFKWTGHSDFKSMKTDIDIATKTKSDAMQKIADSLVGAEIIAILAETDLTDMKRVIVISTSLRRGSNSDMLADKFVEGAKASGEIEECKIAGCL